MVSEEKPLRHVFPEMLPTLPFMSPLVTYEIMSLPACTAASTDASCTMGSWTVAGIVGAVLGVAATVLTFLGAFAVAAWWLGLEKRVRDTLTK